jgi:hypothetical protein
MHYVPVVAHHALGTMQPYDPRRVAILSIALGIAACDSSQTATASVQAPQTPRGAFLQYGNIKRLNLTTPEAQASVIYKDPVQGMKDATGACRFPYLGKMRIGLMAAVGEWNIETCAGLLYYFRNTMGPAQKPSQEDTAFPSPEPATR